MILLDSHLYHAGASDRLRHLVLYIARAGKYIHHALKTGDLGLAGSSNLFGEHQLALDVLSDKIIEENLRLSRLVTLLMSEEKEEPVFLEAPESAAELFSVAYDPLDGSSLVDVNFAVGSIFSIYPGSGSKGDSKGSFLGRTGSEQVAALYIMYGPRTTLTVSLGKGVHTFSLNDVGEFALTQSAMQIAPVAKHFAPGNLRATQADKRYHALVNAWMQQGLTLRYSGGMVPDLHHLFAKGEGIFSYPASLPKYPQGKLRLLFECNPFAYLARAAGGAASNGTRPILDIKVEDLHQRTPIYIGSSKTVEETVRALG